MAQTVEFPDFKELNQKQESLKWQGKIPTFCPKCEEIRGESPTMLLSTTQGLMFRSFGMCSECYLLTRDHPEQAEENKKHYAEMMVIKKVAAIEAVKAKRFRVYFLDQNEKMSNSDYVNSISPVKFGKYPNFHSRGLSCKSKERVREEEAEATIALLKLKNIEGWIEEETI
jgi:hypothetical protein